MIAVILFFARLMGKTQSAIGRGQTHLLSLAQARGWDPGDETRRMQLELRQAGLALRAVHRRMRADRKRALRRLPRSQRKALMKGGSRK